MNTMRARTCSQVQDEMARVDMRTARALEFPKMVIDPAFQTNMKSRGQKCDSFSAKSELT